MESSKSITKEFVCGKHPNEEILSFSSIESPTVLYCADCLLSIGDKQIKEAALPIKEFIQHTAAYFEKLTPHGKTLNGDPPKELLVMLDGEDELIAKVSTRIETEKVKVENSFEGLIQNFTTLCNKAKQEIFSNLDNQLINIRSNYRYYKRKVNKYYGKQIESEDIELTTERGIVTAINKCETVADLECLVKQINDEMAENKYLDSLDDRTNGMNEILAELKHFIKTQGELLPKSQFSDPMQAQNPIIKLHKAFADFAEAIPYIENEIVQLSFNSSITTIDSKILKNHDEVQMLQKWLSSNPTSIKFKLLLRGSRDGFDTATFHNKCDNKQNTLVLVRTEFDRVCGGFTEANWKHVGNSFTQDNNSFLFSIDHKTKFPIKPGAYATFPHESYGPNFGTGYDLFVANNCNMHPVSFSNFGVSYDAGKFGGIDVKNSSLGGAQHFRVEEYEVFEVEGYKSQTTLLSIPSKETTES